MHRSCQATCLLDECHIGHIRGVRKAPAGSLENTSVTWSWDGGSQRCRSRPCQMVEFCFHRLLPGLCCSRYADGEKSHRVFVERQGLHEIQCHGRVAHQKANTRQQNRHICGKRSLQKHILQKHSFVSHTSECFGEEEEEAMAEMSPVPPCAVSAQAPAGKSLQQ